MVHGKQKTFFMLSSNQNTLRAIVESLLHMFYVTEFKFNVIII